MTSAAPVIDTSDMDPELARYLNRNYWQQKSVELKSSSAAAAVTQPSAPAITAADTKMSTAGGGGSAMNSATGLQQQNADDEVAVTPSCFHACYNLTLYQPIMMIFWQTFC